MRGRKVALNAQPSTMPPLALTERYTYYICNINGITKNTAQPVVKPVGQISIQSVFLELLLYDTGGRHCIFGIDHTKYINT